MRMTKESEIRLALEECLRLMQPTGLLRFRDAIDRGRAALAPVTGNTIAGMSGEVPYSPEITRANAEDGERPL